MTYLVIACPMLREELTQAVTKVNTSCEVRYLAAAVHERPATGTVQLAALTADGGAYEAVLLPAGCCGRLCPSAPVRLVWPRVDDCLELLLWPRSREMGVFYLTPAWLAGAGSFLSQEQRLSARYGANKARAVLRRMVKGYRTLAFIELFPGQAASYAEPLGQVSELLALPLTTVAGSTALLEALLSGQWDERFMMSENI